MIAPVPGTAADPADRLSLISGGASTIAGTSVRKAEAGPLPPPDADVTIRENVCTMLEKKLAKGTPAA
jgi:hypothetical protein